MSPSPSQNDHVETEDGEIVETPGQEHAKPRTPLKAAGNDGHKRRASSSGTLEHDKGQEGREEGEEGEVDRSGDQEYQVKNSFGELASSSSSVNASHSPAKIRKLRHADPAPLLSSPLASTSTSTASSRSPSEGLKAIHIGDKDKDKDDKMDADMTPASPTGSVASSDHRSTTSSHRKRSHSRDTSDYRRRPESSRNRSRDSSGRQDSRSSRSQRSPSPRHSSSRR